MPLSLDLSPTLSQGEGAKLLSSTLLLNEQFVKIVVIQVSLPTSILLRVLSPKGERQWKKVFEKGDTAAHFTRFVPFFLLGKVPLLGRG